MGQLKMQDVKIFLNLLVANDHEKKQKKNGQNINLTMR